MSTKHFFSDDSHICLGVYPHASDRDIHLAYRELIRQWHLDRYHVKTEEAAYETLQTPVIDVNREKSSTFVQEMFKNAKSKAVGDSSRFMVKSR